MTDNTTDWATLSDQQRNELVHKLVARSTSQPVPDYVHDLNAVHALEMQQTDSYGLRLSHVASRAAYAAQLPDDATANRFYYLLATLGAEQRCKMLCEIVSEQP